MSHQFAAAGRLDVELVAGGLVASRNQARQAIEAGRVVVNGVRARKASQLVSVGDRVEVEVEAWVSRASHKLLGALDDAQISVPARCLDAGASTGGFTQVLLSRGAEVVYAVDVGHGQLASPIQGDPRVRAREGVNIKDLRLADLDGQPVRLAVADLSFISLTLVLPALLPLIAADGDALVLVKPQFEVGRGHLGSSGVVRSDRLRQQAVDNVAAVAAGLGWGEVWRGQSCLPGAHGNIEWFIHLHALLSAMDDRLVE